MTEFESDTQKSDSKNIISDLVKAIIGVTLFFLSLSLLWKNEGRIDIPALIRGSIPVSAESGNLVADNELISVTGTIESEDSLGDPGFLGFGPYIAVNRRVEMYAWAEHAPGDEESGFTYEKEWTDSPADSVTFIEPDRHVNPNLPLQSRSYVVKKATIGAYGFLPAFVRMPAASSLSLTKKMYIRSVETHLRGNYLYIGRNTKNEPRVGDVRLSYSVIPTGITATLFGRVTTDTVEPYVCKNNAQIYQLLLGSRQEALSQIPTPNNHSVWILRLAGLIIMWGGLYLCLVPLIARSTFAPMLKEAKQVKFVGMLLIAAVGFTLLTLLVSALFRNVYVLGIALAALCGAIYFLAAKRMRFDPLSAVWKKRSNLPVAQNKPSQRTGRDSSEDSVSTQRPFSSQKPRANRTTLPLHEQHIQQTDPDSQANYASPPPAPPGGESQAVAEKKIRIFCERCGVAYTVPDSYRGRKVRCSKCEHRFYVQVGSTDADATPTVMDISSKENR